MAFSGPDDDFRLLAGGFPKLKKFVVSGPQLHNRGFAAGGRTLACLYYLSRECPDLREIKIALWSNISNNLIHHAIFYFLVARLGLRFT